jgi:hypothetical protein
MEVAMVITGLLMTTWSLYVLFRGNNPVADFNFKNGTYDFELKSEGYYSVSILGAGFISERQRIDVTLRQGEDDPVKVKPNWPAVRFTKNGEVGMEHWGFSTVKPGHCVLSFENLEDLEVKSAVEIKHVFNAPVQPDNLKILIHASAHPLIKLIAILTFVAGAFFFVEGALTLIHQINSIQS